MIYIIYSCVNNGALRFLRHPLLLLVETGETGVQQYVKKRPRRTYYLFTPCIFVPETEKHAYISVFVNFI